MSKQSSLLDLTKIFLLINFDYEIQVRLLMEFQPSVNIFIFYLFPQLINHICNMRKDLSRFVFIN